MNLLNSSVGYTIRIKRINHEKKGKYKMTKALESPGLLENYSTIFTGNELKNNENM